MAKGRRKGCLFLVILTGIFVGAYLTNPTEDMHREAAKEKLNKMALNLLSKYGIEESFVAGLGIDLSGKYEDEFIQNHVSADNYYLFSTTRVHWSGESRIIGVGAFGRVYISGKVDEILERELENFVKEKIEGIKIPGFDLKDFKLELDL